MTSVGLEVDDEKVLLEAGRTRDDGAGVVEHDGMSVEDEFVLPADEIAEGEVRARVAGPRDQHLLALLGLADVERRGREVHDQLRAGKREIRLGRAGLPDVLADRDTDGRLSELQDDEVAPLREVPVLVEDAVVRKEVLAVDGSDSPLGADRAGVREVAVEPWCPDERDETLCRGCDLLERLTCRADETRPEEEILGWIAARRELREDDEIGSRGARVVQRREDPRAIAVEVADHGIQLCESDSHSFRLTVTNRV